MHLRSTGTMFSTARCTGGSTEGWLRYHRDAQCRSTYKDEDSRAEVETVFGDSLDEEKSMNAEVSETSNFTSSLSSYRRSAEKSRYSQTSEHCVFYDSTLARMPVAVI